MKSILSLSIDYKIAFFPKCSEVSWMQFIWPIDLVLTENTLDFVSCELTYWFIDLYWPMHLYSMKKTMKYLTALQIWLENETKILPFADLFHLLRQITPMKVKCYSIQLFFLMKMSCFCCVTAEITNLFKQILPVMNH